MNKVLDFTAMLVVRAMNSVKEFKDDFESDERGDFVQVALLILIAIAVFVIFRDQITDFVNQIFGKLFDNTGLQQSNPTGQ